MFKFITILLLLSGGFFALAQSNPNRGGEKPTGEIFGSIVDSLTSKPIDYVTVVAFSQKDGKLVKGGVTDENGRFSLKDIPFGIYKLKISFVGYKTNFVSDVALNKDKSTFELKGFTLAPNVLKTVTVVGGTPDITYEIDKKVINVEDQLNTDGQTAVEVLQNIPSVTVGADGTVSLRGSSSFTLLIDGIPTAMDANDALAVIPANTIQDIEIITNPNAKFDAEGSSGVINIITKKSKLEGTSCLVNLAGGTFDNYSGDIALNLKREKFTIDVSARANQRSRPRDVYTERLTAYDSLRNLLISEGESNWKRRSVGGAVDVQYKPNSAHTFVAKSDFNSMLMTPYTNFDFESYDDGVLVDKFANQQQNNINLLGFTGSLFYQHNIKRNKNHKISFKAIANLKGVQQSDTTLSRDEAGQITAGNLYTETGPSNSYRFNVDYTLPLKKDRKFEAGLQSQFGQSGDIGKNYTYNTSTAVYDFNPLFSSDVDYVRDVHAAYSMFNGKYKGLGYQAGLRAEYTYRNITSTNFTDFTTINRLDLFPSAHLSYSFDNKVQLLLSYSRRIERPRSWYFEPFITWESPFEVRTGNPNLVPEYINASELSIIKPLKQKRGYLSMDVYYRYNQNSIQRISTVYEEGILIEQPYNIGNSTSMGIEPAFIYTIKDWWKINTAYNFFLFRLEGSINDVSYNTQSFNYGGRFTNTFELKDDWVIQLVSNYESGTVTPQGTENGNFRQDISIRKSFAKKRFSLSLMGRNILNTQITKSTWTTGNVTINSVREPLFPMVTLNLSIRLNNYQKIYDKSEKMDDF